VKAAAYLRVFEKFIAAFKGRLSEVNPHNIDDLPALCSQFDVEELLSALEVVDTTLPHAGVSSIDSESYRHVLDVEEKILQNECSAG
jgi:hypothetical protein